MDITRRCDYALRILEAAYESGDSYVSDEDSIAAVRISHIGLVLESRFCPALRFS